MTPSVTREQAKELRAIPITCAMGIRLAHSIRSMAQIVANGNGMQFFTTAEKCSEARNYRLQVWRLP